MNVEERQKVTGFERGLMVGSEVVVRWTNCGSCWEGRGVVTKVNCNSFRVRLTEEVLNGRGEVAYPVGREITAPSFRQIEKWSAYNCLMPEGGY